MLNIAQAGAIRAQLKQQKRLKLKVRKTVGKAYTKEEKQAIVDATRNEARRSKAIHFATMLAIHAGLRDKEIRTLQWSNLDLAKRIVTVGETKSDAGTGRTIPLNEDPFAAAVEYSKWYTGKFLGSDPAWFVFSFGRRAPQDPTRPVTSLKKSWHNTRADAGISGRFHDNRHTFVTDLAESGAGDQVIQDMVGHVSKDMVKHYSHIRTEAKRKAVEELSRIGKTGTQKKDQSGNLESVPQVSPQVEALT